MTGPAHRAHRAQPAKPRRPTPRWLSTSLVLVKAGALGGLLTLVVAGALGGGLDGTARSAAPGTSARAETHPRVVERAVAEHRCSYTGFGDEKVPASALIRTDRGAVREVSFEVGWDVYNGRRPGTLIAVCLDGKSSLPLRRVHG